MRRKRTLLLEGGIVLAALVLGKLLDSPYGYCAAAVLAVAFLVAWYRGKEDDEEEFESKSLFNGAIPGADHVAEAQPRPSISGEILSVFWSKATDAKGNLEPRNSNFFVKLKVVNHKDVSCMIDKYWLTLTVGGHDRRCLGIPSKSAKLEYQSPTDSQATEMDIHPLTINYDTPLKLALPREGWITFYVIECDMPPAPFWLMPVKLAVTDSLGNEHPIGSSSATVFPATVDTREPNPKPNLAFGNRVSMQKVVEESGRLRLFVPNETAMPMLAVTVEARNLALDERAAASAGRVKAQLCFRLKQGEYVVAPGAWLDEPYSSVRLDVGDTRRLILAVSESFLYGWKMVSNKRTAADDPFSLDHTRDFPLFANGTLEVKLIGSGSVLRTLKIGVTWPHQRSLEFSDMEEE